MDRATKSEIEKMLPPLPIRDGQFAPVASYLTPMYRGISRGVIGVSFTNITQWVGGVLNILDPERISLAWNYIASLHPIITSKLTEGDAGVCFEFFTGQHLKVEFVDISNSGEKDKGDLLKGELDRYRYQPFDLNVDKLLRAFAIRVSDSEYYVGFVLHHFIGDLNSVNIIADTLIAALASPRAPDPAPRPATINFADYARIVGAWVDSAQGRAASDYWRALLAEAPATKLVKAPMDDGSASSMTISFNLSKEAETNLRQAAQTLGVTTFSILLAAKFNALKSVTGQLDLGVLVINTHRSFAPLTNVVGNLMNLTPFRINCGADESTASLARRIHAQRVAGLRHSLYPYTVLAYRDITMPPMPRFNFMDRVTRRPSTSDTSSADGRGPALPALAPSVPFKQAVEGEESFYLEMDSTGSGIVGSLTFWGDRRAKAIHQDFINNFTNLLDSLEISAR